MATTKKAAKKTRKPRKQYSPEKRDEIMADAKSNKLSGKQVAEKYGISVMTYYLWTKKAGGLSRATKASRRLLPLGAGFESQVRAAIEAKVRELLPEIVNRELQRQLVLSLKS